MNESTFRSLFRSAIGEPEVPAHLSNQARLALKQSLDRQTPRLREGLAVLAALVAAVAVVATLLAPRVAHARAAACSDFVSITVTLASNLTISGSERLPTTGRR